MRHIAKHARSGTEPRHKRGSLRLSPVAAKRDALPRRRRHGIRLAAAPTRAGDACRDSAPRKITCLGASKRHAARPRRKGCRAKDLHLLRCPTAIGKRRHAGARQTVECDVRSDTDGKPGPLHRLDQAPSAFSPFYERRLAPHPAVVHLPAPPLLGDIAPEPAPMLFELIRGGGDEIDRPPDIVQGERVRIGTGIRHRDPPWHGAVCLRVNADELIPVPRRNETSGARRAIFL